MQYEYGTETYLTENGYNYNLNTLFQNNEYNSFLICSEIKSCNDQRKTDKHTLEQCHRCCKKVVLLVF